MKKVTHSWLNWCDVMGFYQHDSAIVDEGLKLETVLEFGTSCMCAGARIGKEVSLGQNVFVGNKVSIGDRCKIQNNVSVYDNVTLEEGSFVDRVWYLQMSIIHVR